jgi:hypothetical protein
VSGIEDLDREGLLKVMARDRYVKQQLAERITGLVSENTELIALINEMDSDLAEARSALQALQAQQQPDA